MGTPVAGRRHAGWSVRRRRRKKAMTPSPGRCRTPAGREPMRRLDTTVFSPQGAVRGAFALRLPAYRSMTSVMPRWHTEQKGTRSRVNITQSTWGR